MAVLQKIVATLPSNTASPSAALLVLVLGVIATLALTLYRRHRASSELKLPFLRFEDGDDSRQRYATDSGTLFKIGYEKVSTYPRQSPAFSLPLFSFPGGGMCSAKRGHSVCFAG